MGPNMLQPDPHLLDLGTVCRGDDCDAMIYGQYQSWSKYGADVQCPFCGFWQWVQVDCD